MMTLSISFTRHLLAIKLAARFTYGCLSSSFGTDIFGSQHNIHEEHPASRQRVHQQAPSAVPSYLNIVDTC